MNHLILKVAYHMMCSDYLYRKFLTKTCLRKHSARNDVIKNERFSVLSNKFWKTVNKSGLVKKKTFASPSWISNWEDWLWQWHDQGLREKLPLSSIHKSSCSQMFFKIRVLKNLANFAEKHHVGVPWRPENLL